MCQHRLNGGSFDFSSVLSLRLQIADGLKCVVWATTGVAD